MPIAKLVEAAKNGFVITLRRSPIGTPQKHRRVLSGLGLRKIRQTVTRPNTPQVRGMICKVGNLMEVQPQLTYKSSVLRKDPGNDVSVSAVALVLAMGKQRGKAIRVCWPDPEVGADRLADLKAARCP